MSKTILVVDDSATVRQQLKLALQPAGFIVVEAVDGVDGLAKIKSMPAIAMVICDVNMPRMNGIDMVTAVRDAKIVVPIVMLTTEGSPGLINAAKAAGAKGWIVKPFNAGVLLKAVQKLAA